MVFQPLMKGLAVEIAGAFVEQIGGKMGCAGLVGVVLAGAAMECVIQRDQRHRLLAHQPGLDTAGLTIFSIVIADATLAQRDQQRRGDKACDATNRIMTASPPAGSRP